jgi:hypothetical protein
VRRATYGHPSTDPLPVLIAAAATVDAFDRRADLLELVTNPNLTGEQLLTIIDSVPDTDNVLRQLLVMHPNCPPAAVRAALTDTDATVVAAAAVNTSVTLTASDLDTVAAALRIPVVAASVLTAVSPRHQRWKAALAQVDTVPDVTAVLIAAAANSRLDQTSVTALLDAAQRHGVTGVVAAALTANTTVPTRAAAVAAAAAAAHPAPAPERTPVPFHVRHHAVASPGTQLADIVSRTDILGVPDVRAATIRVTHDTQFGKKFDTRASKMANLAADGVRWFELSHVSIDEYSAATGVAVTLCFDPDAAQQVLGRDPLTDPVGVAITSRHGTPVAFTLAGVPPATASRRVRHATTTLSDAVSGDELEKLTWTGAAKTAVTTHAGKTNQMRGELLDYAAEHSAAAAALNTVLDVAGEVSTTVRTVTFAANVATGAANDDRKRTAVLSVNPTELANTDVSIVRPLFPADEAPAALRAYIDACAAADVIEPEERELLLTQVDVALSRSRRATRLGDMALRTVEAWRFSQGQSIWCAARLADIRAGRLRPDESCAHLTEKPSSQDDQ